MIYFRAILIIFVLLSAGCAGSSLHRARAEFYSGNPARADQFLAECREIPEKDRLLCYMEKGIILHDLREYEKSTEILLKASRLISEQDIVSVKDQSAAVMINDRVMIYKGEYSERLWVHTFLMMNFLLQYKYESALVEGRQALEVFDEYPDSLKDDFFTRALIALCFENMNLPDDARIEFDKLAEAMDAENIVSEPILQDKGELILFIAQGSIPGKVSSNIIAPPSIRISIPRYAESSAPPPVTIRSDCSIDILQQITTDLGSVARKSLNDRAVHYLTRQTLRAGTKEVIAREVGNSSELAEIAVRAILFFLEEADTRSWETLPGGLTLVRIVLDPGTHNLEVLSSFSGPVYLDGIEIPEGKKVYRSLRF